jgi:hypothetical protein
VKHLSLTTLSLGLALALGLPAFADTLKKPALDQLVAAHRAKPPPTLRPFLAQAAKANPRLKAGVAAYEKRRRSPATIKTRPTRPASSSDTGGRPQWSSVPGGPNNPGSTPQRDSNPCLRRELRAPSVTRFGQSHFCSGCRANRFSLVKLSMLASGYLTVIGDQIPAAEPAPGSHGTKVPLWGGPAISRFALGTAIRSVSRRKDGRPG